MLSPSPAAIHHKLDTSVGVSGRHDFAVRDTRIRLVRHRVHRIPHQRFVTIAKRPSLRARDARTLPVIWGNDQPRHLRPIGTTGKSVAMKKFVSSEQQLLAAIVSRTRVAALSAAPQSRDL